jgi:hypothetical protein
VSISIRTLRAAAVLFAVLVSSSAVAVQSGEVTAADIQRLQAAVDETARDIASMRGRDGALAADLQSDLDSAREDLTYLKVKLRRNETVSEREFADLQTRVDNIRSRARGDVTGGSSNPSAPRSTDKISESGDRARTTSRADANEIPVDTEFDVRLQTALSSATAKVEDRVEATTVVDMEREGQALVPAGSLVTGLVRSVNKATRTDRKGSLTVAFDQVTVRGRSYPIRATVTQALQGEGIAGEKAKIGAGAGVGAIIGGILGGFKGALAGILIGGGGTIAATEGTDVQLPPGTVLRVRLDSPLILDR